MSASPSVESALQGHEAIQSDRHFRTDHLVADLKGRSVRGGAVTVSAQAAKLLLQTGSTAVLARILTPADFGLIAMVATVTGFAALFKDLGLSQATIQAPRITHEQVSSLFWINVAVSALIGLVIAASAPAIAWFYSEPRLLWVTVALGATFLFAGVSAQHTALLRRQMRFGPLAIASVGSQVAGILVAVVMAMRGSGYWALVGMVAAQEIASAVLTWMASGWSPGRPTRAVGLRPMLRTGANLTGFSCLNYMIRNFDNVLIGAVLGAGPLGIYSKAYGLLLLPISQLSAPMTAVALPALSRLQSRPAEFVQYFQTAVGLVAFTGMPVVVFCAVAAREIVPLLLGPGWDAVVPLFWCLAPAAFVGTLNVAPGWLCGSLGNTHRQLRWALCAAPITVAGFALGITWGAIGVAVAFSTTWCLLLIALIWYSGRGTSVGMRHVVAAVWRSAVAAAAAGLMTLMVVRFLAHSGLAARLAAAGATYATVYLVCFAGLPGGSALLRGMVRNTAMLRNRSA